MRVPSASGGTPEEQLSPKCGPLAMKGQMSDSWPGGWGRCCQRRRTNDHELARLDQVALGRIDDAVALMRYRGGLTRLIPR